MKKISPKKLLSKEKETFLAIALIAGTVSAKTVQKMKEHLPENKVSKVIIYTLINNGCLFKLGKGNSANYLLTQKGLEYLHAKYPNKYNYELYRKRPARNIDINRERYEIMSYCLYWLTCNNIDISNHQEDLIAILKGEKVKLKKSFFVPVRELAECLPGLRGSFGYSAMGIIVSDTNITVVYCPTSENQLQLSNEEKFYNSISNSISRSVTSEGQRYTQDTLFLYSNAKDIVESFSNKATTSGRTASTRRVLERYINRRMYMLKMFDECVSYELLRDAKRCADIDEVFFDYYDLSSVPPKKLSDIYIDGYYEEITPSFICWSLPPSKILGALEYLQNNKLKADEHIIIIGFEEQKHIFEGIVSKNKSLMKHVMFATIPHKEIQEYLEGHINKIA